MVYVYMYMLLDLIGLLHYNKLFFIVARLMVEENERLSAMEPRLRMGSFPSSTLDIQVTLHLETSTKYRFHSCHNASAEE